MLAAVIIECLVFHVCTLEAKGGGTDHRYAHLGLDMTIIAEHGHHHLSLRSGTLHWRVLTASGATMPSTETTTTTKVW